MFEYFFIFLSIIIGGLILAALKRNFSSETLANGYMNTNKGQEIAPKIFSEKKD